MSIAAATGPELRSAPRLSGGGAPGAAFVTASVAEPTAASATFATPSTTAPVTAFATSEIGAPAGPAAPTTASMTLLEADLVTSATGSITALVLAVTRSVIVPGTKVFGHAPGP